VREERERVRERERERERPVGHCGLSWLRFRVKGLGSAV